MRMKLLPPVHVLSVSEVVRGRQYLFTSCLLFNFLQVIVSNFQKSIFVFILCTHFFIFIKMFICD